jgi:hypothetical protein
MVHQKNQKTARIRKDPFDILGVPNENGTAIAAFLSSKICTRKRMLLSAFFSRAEYSATAKLLKISPHYALQVIETVIMKRWKQRVQKRIRKHKLTDSFPSPRPLSTPCTGTRTKMHYSLDETKNKAAVAGVEVSWAKGAPLELAVWRQ